LVPSTTRNQGWQFHEWYLNGVLRIAASGKARGGKFVRFLPNPMALFVVITGSESVSLEATMRGTTMKKFVFTTAVALVLATSAYAQHHGGGGGGGGGRGGGGGGGMSAHVGGGGGPGGAPSMSRGSSGPSNFSSMSRGPSGPSNMSRGPSGRSNFAQGPQGRTLYNQERGTRNLYNHQGDVDRGKFDRDNRIGRDVDRNHGADFRHRGVVSGNFSEHGRHFRFRRFFNGEWVFLNAWDDCTAWAWVNVAPGAWAWRPINVCIG
jgi:hypothetical protein